MISSQLKALFAEAKLAGYQLHLLAEAYDPRPEPPPPGIRCYDQDGHCLSKHDNLPAPPKLWVLPEGERLDRAIDLTREEDLIELRNCLRRRWWKRAASVLLRMEHSPRQRGGNP
jgi:hypothetical protein